MAEFEINMNIKLTIDAENNMQARHMAYMTLFEGTNIFEKVNSITVEWVKP